MLGIQEFNVRFLSDQTWLVLLVSVLLLLLTWWLYRRTNPPLPRYQRIILGSLRAVAIVAMMAALFEPIVTIARSYERERRVSVLVDASASMNRTEDGLTRAGRVDSLLSSQDYSRLGNQTETSVHFFGDSLYRSRSAVRDESSAMGEALYALAQQEADRPSDAWLVLSDGRTNTGRSPRASAEGLNVPVTVINAATAGSGFDIGLEDLNFNPVVFSGQPAEIEVRLGWQDAAGRTAAVQLLDDSEVLDDQTVPIEIEDGRADVSLKYVPGEPGQQLLRVRIPTLEGEASRDNNEQTISVKVLRSRLNVLLATATPDYEVGFLKRWLESSDKYELDFVATGARSGNLAGELPRQVTEMNRYDLVILHDPDPQRLQSRAEVFRSFLADKGGALWLMMGERYAARAPVAWLGDILPFSRTRPAPLQRLQFQGLPEEGQLLHPAVRLADDQAGTRAAWAELPPFRSLVPCDALAEGAMVLVTTEAGNTARPWPVLGYRRVGPGKVLASSALPFWTWSFASLGLGDDGGRYGRFLEGVLSWLTVSDDYDPVKIAPVKEVFTRGEPVAFRGHAFDLGFRPLLDVGGTIKLLPQGDGEAREVDLAPVGDGNYRAELDGVVPDRYRYQASMVREGREIHFGEGQLVVESYSLEEYDQRPDPAALAAIADLTGGGFFAVSEFAEALASIDRTPVEVTSETEYPLTGRTWLLALAIVAFGLEWLLRKILQLI